MGFFLEAVPWYPALAATAFPGLGASPQENMKLAAHTALHIAVGIDGFHDDIPAAP